jgi:hypothetical protein
MSKVLFEQFRKLSLIVFVLGMATVGYAYYATRSQTTKATGFTLYSTISFTRTGSSESKITGTRVRYQKADGSFKQVTTYLKADGTVGKTDTLLGQLGHGVFEIAGNDKVMSFLSPMRSQIPPVSEAQLRTTHNHHILRDEVILGYKTLVVRIQDNPDSAGYVELYHAPDLQGLPIRTVNVSDAGMMVIEPTKIQLGEPAESEMSASALPISYDHFEMKIQTLDETGQKEAADKLRQQLRDAKKQ